MANYLLTTLICLPVIGAGSLLFAKGRNSIRWSALISTLITFAVSLLLLGFFDWHKGTLYSNNSSSTVQLVQDAVWIQSLNIHYKVGIDGLSFPLVILTTFISVLACIASWNIDKMLKGYLALFLLLEAAILGVFLSLDFFLFYVFLQLTLLPLYFLIRIWGGPRKEHAAVKFFLYSLISSIAMLIVLIGTCHYSKQVYSHGTFDLITLASPEFQSHLAPLIAGLSGTIAKTFFCLLMFAFLIRLPAVPFHNWLPDAHAQAPVPINMILALLLNTGAYGIFRIAYPLFPTAAKTLWLPLAIIGVISILYGSLVAISQTHFKRLLAYSSISQTGLITLGAAMMTCTSISGALFVMIAQSITSAMLFFAAGVLHDRAHHLELKRFGGIATTMPIYARLSSIAFFANMGLPGLCGFVGELMVLLGTFQAARNDSILVHAGFATPHQIYPLAILACFSIIPTAAYTLRTLQHIFLGPQRPNHQSLPDTTPRELLILTSLAIPTLLLGILPTIFLFTFTHQSVSALLKLLL